MKTLPLITALLGILLLAGCAHDPIPAAPRAKPMRPPKGREAANCTRSQPVALLKADGRTILSEGFQRVSPHEARETARLLGNILLTVTHTGCTRTAYVFAFHLPEVERPFSARGYWYRRAAALLRAIGAEDFRDLAQTLDDAGDPAYGETLRVGEFQRVALDLRSERRGAVVYIRYDFAL